MAKPKNKLNGSAKMFINKVYIENRMAYAYDTLLPQSFRDKVLTDNSKSPFYLLKTSDFSETKTSGNPPVTDPKVPLEGLTKDNYNSYISGDTSVLSDVNDIGISIQTDDEYKESTDTKLRLKELRKKQFVVFVNYINELGKIYREEILKFIKRNNDRVFTIGDNIDFNETDSRTDKTMNTYGDVLPTDKSYTTKVKAVNDTIFNTIRNQKTDDPNNPSLIIPSIFWFGGSDMIREDKRTTLPESLYTELLALEQTFEKEIFNAKVPDILTYLKNNLKKVYDSYTQESRLITTAMKYKASEPVDTDENRQLFEDEYKRQLDDDVTLNVLDTQNEYLQYRNKYGDQFDTLNISTSKQVWVAYRVRDIKDGDQYDNEDNTSRNKSYMKHKSESEKQYFDERVRKGQERYTDELGNEQNIDPKDVRDNMGYRMDDYDKDGDVDDNRSAFQKWIEIFIASEEYKDFVKKSNVEVNNENIMNDEEYEKKMNPTLDTSKPESSETYNDADAFEAEDPDSLNIDLIDKLRKQEEEFNKTIADLQAPFEKEQEEQKAKNTESLKKLQEKIASVSGDMFKKLDEGMTKNKQNRVERQKQKTEKEIEERTKEDKDSALSSLRNYKSCTSKKPTKEDEPPERVLQDVNLQDIIAQSGRQLTGGRKKKNSVANQVYLLNKRYVDSNGFESPLVRTNSARKKGGAKEDTKVDEALGIQGTTTDYQDITGIDSQINDMSTAMTVLDVADTVVGAIPIVGDLFSAGIGITNIIMAEEIKKKEQERNARIAENQRIYDSWLNWKDDMIEQLVTTLGNQEDPEVYKKMKEKALQTFRKIDKDNEPDKREVAEFSKQLDAEREVLINSRKAITDKMAQNGEEIVDKIADILQQQDEERTALVDEGFNERQKVIDAFTTQLKDYIKKYTDEESKLNEEDEKVEEQAEKVADMVEEKQEELEDEAEDIAELKGYSACKTNAKTAEQLRAEALEDLEEEQDKLEEAQAQGTAPMQGLGKRYKKYNKNSIANQVYLLNMKYIKSF